MLNTVQEPNKKCFKIVDNTQYERIPAAYIAKEMYSALLDTDYNQEFLEKFDNIPQHKLNDTLKSYGNKNEFGLLTDMYINLGISIRDLKPRILRIINLVSFKDKEKRTIWKLYSEFNDFDDFLEEHNAVIIKKIDNLLLQVA